MNELFSRVNAGFLFTAIVIVALLIVVFVVVVGGIVCIDDPHYNFSEYLGDLGFVYKLLAAAVLGATGRALLDRDPRSK